MSDSKTVYNEIIETKNQKTCAVFDLDSTLYNVSHRTQQILLEFTKETSHLEQYGPVVTSLSQVKVQAMDWGLKESIQRHGIQVTPDLFRHLRDFWSERFFSSEYLKYDRPYTGSIEYVNALKEKGIEILYLTGRDMQNMKTGTIQSLQRWGYPLHDESSQLYMKPHKGFMEDEDFKAKIFDQIIKNFEKIWFFENEPLIVHKVIAVHPHIQIVWIDTTHSRRSPPPGEVYVIQDQWSFK